MLIAHADDLDGKVDQLDPNPLPHRPSVAQGWGRVNLDKLIAPNVDYFVLDEDHSPIGGRRFDLYQPQLWQITLEVADPNEEVIIALVFTDCAGTLGAASAEVNNLDLLIFDTFTNCYCGNRFDTDGYSQAGWAQKSCNASINNVEVVHLEEGWDIQENTFGVRDFTVSVRAINLAAQCVPGLDGIPNQDWALYVYNAREVN